MSHSERSTPSTWSASSRAAQLRKGRRLAPAGPEPEQLTLRVDSPNGGRMPLKFTERVGTPDWALESVLAASVKLREEGGCWCKERARERGERHSVKRCKCRCHVRRKK